MLRVKNVSYAYDKGLVLKNINLKIAKGEHLALIGESGCGKSTLLKIMYGLMDLKEGSVLWKDEPVLGPAYNLVPGAPFMKYLSQDFDLMPFISVAENIAQYLSVFYPAELKERTTALLEMIALTDFANKKVNTLSGGQQQRVALARVLAQKPEVLLLDEPFGHIDNFLKNNLRRNIFKYAKDNEITCIVATHDHNDVLPFMDRMIVLRDAGIITEGRPMELYRNPRNLYVASLFGEANSISMSQLKSYAQSDKTIIVYAHELKASDTSGLAVTVKESYPMGNYYLNIGTMENGESIYFQHSTVLPKGKELYLNISLNTINQRIR
jgi:ABC-type Fe3+/spermidine/putrescine transport system ATPase subunit